MGGGYVPILWGGTFLGPKDFKAAIAEPLAICPQKLFQVSKLDENLYQILTWRLYQNPGFNIQRYKGTNGPVPVHVPGTRVPGTRYPGFADQRARVPYPGTRYPP
eukprot:3236329-Rhodomonas_salina.5